MQICPFSGSHPATTPPPPRHHLTHHHLTHPSPPHARSLREERHKLELALEESKSAQKQAEKVAEEARDAARKAADVADSLRKAAEAAGVELDDHLVETSKYLPTSEQEIGLLKAEIADLKTRVFDPKKAMSMLSQMPSLGMISSMPMMMGLGGMQKVASMPNFLADGIKRETGVGVGGDVGGMASVGGVGGVGTSAVPPPRSGA